MLKLGAFAILLLFVASCSNRGYILLSESEYSINEISGVFNDDFEKALYQTTINIYKHNLTGMTLIKKTDDSYRVVSMSEMGVKYFDIEVRLDAQNQPIVHYIMEMMDIKPLVNILLRDFQILFKEPVTDSKVKTENQTRLIKDGKLIFYEKPVGITAIKKSRCLLSDKPIIQLDRTVPVFPDTIVIDHGKINFKYIRITD